MGIKHIAEFLPHLQQRVARISFGVKLSQPVPDNAADEAGGMRHQHCEMRRIAGSRLIPRCRTEPFDQTQKGRGIVPGNRFVDARIVAVGVKRVIRDHDSAAALVAALEQTELGEIANRPGGQFLEPFELPLVVRIAPVCRIGRFCRRLEFDKGARRHASPDEGDIRPTDTGAAILGRNDQPLRNGEEKDQSLKQSLEFRGKRRFRHLRVCPAKFPDAMRIGLQEKGDVHRLSRKC